MRHHVIALVLALTTWLGLREKTVRDGENS